MALELNLTFQRSLDRQSILVTDLTGSGATGYGGSNPAVGDFSAFEITVTPADSLTYLPTGTAVTIDAYPSLPSASDGTFTITSLALLGTADSTIPDGVYKFDITGTYDDGGGEDTVTGTFYAVYYEITECCIRRLIMDLVTCNCRGNSEKVQTLSLALLGLSCLIGFPFNGVIQDSYVVENELWADAATILVGLNDICVNQNCGGCGGCS